VTLAVTGNSIYGRVFRRYRDDGVSVASTGVNEKSTKRTVGEL
jgi:ABC-type branched-subunit amino acid transport system permease subunit